MGNIEVHKFVGYKFGNSNEIYESEIDLSIINGELRICIYEEVFMSKLLTLQNIVPLVFIDRLKFEYLVRGIRFIEKSEKHLDDNEYIFGASQIVSKKIVEQDLIMNVEVKYNSNKSYFSLKNNIIQYEDNLIKVNNEKIGNSKSTLFKIAFQQNISYETATNLIRKIRIFLCISEGLKFFEENIKYTLNDSSDHYDFYGSTNYEPGTTRFYYNKLQRIESRMDLSSIEINGFFCYWINLKDSEDLHLSKVVEYFHRNDFSNPSMYFKEIFSYYEELAKKVTKTEKEYDKQLKDGIIKLIDQLNYDEEIKLDYLSKIDLFTESQTVEAIKKFNDQFKEIIVIPDEFLRSWYSVRNKTTHRPAKTFEKTKELNFVASIIYIREILILHLVYSFLNKSNERKEFFSHNLQNMLMSYESKLS